MVKQCSSQYALRSYWYLLLHTGTAAPAAMLFGDGSSKSHVLESCRFLSCILVSGIWVVLNVRAS